MTTFGECIFVCVYLTHIVCSVIVGTSSLLSNLIHLLLYISVSLYMFCRFVLSPSMFCYSFVSYVYSDVSPLLLVLPAECSTNYNTEALLIELKVNCMHLYEQHHFFSYFLEGK